MNSKAVFTYLGENKCANPKEANEGEGVEEAAQPREQVEAAGQLSRGVEVLRYQQAPQIAAKQSQIYYPNQLSGGVEVLRYQQAPQIAAKQSQIYNPNQLSGGVKVLR
jgi:ribosomal protein S30